MKLTIIGAGNMGGATALGFVKSGAAAPSDVTVTARTTTTLSKFDGTGMTATTDNVKAAEGADCIIIAVKPWFVQGVIEQIKPVLDYSSQLIVCMAAGIPSETLLEWLGTDSNGNAPRLAYVIPNTAIEILQSMTFIAPISCTDAQTAVLKSLFDATGESLVVTEKQLEAGTALASCGIAFAMRYIRAAAEGGVELGFYAKDATKVVCQTVKGAAELIMAHGSHPEAEIDKVTTPGGITIKGLNAMEDAGFTSAVIKGLKASHK